MKTTYVLVAVLLAVVVGGVLYITRPEPTGLSPLATSASLIDDTIKIPPVSSSAMIKPITQTVYATLKTSKGDIGIELDGQSAPLTVGNFVQLAQDNFYDMTTFHRVIPDFMIQGGDPLSKDPTVRARHGNGGPAYQFKDEINSRKIVRGSIAMANSGPNTNGSQFFIVTGAAFPHLDGKHTNFGAVTKGMDIVDAISNVEADENDNPIEPVVIEDVVIHEAPFDALKVES